MDFHRWKLPFVIVCSSLCTRQRPFRGSNTAGILLWNCQQSRRGRPDLVEALLTSARMNEISPAAGPAILSHTLATGNRPVMTEYHNARGTTKGNRSEERRVGKERKER